LYCNSPGPDCGVNYSNFIGEITNKVPLGTGPDCGVNYSTKLLITNKKILIKCHSGPVPIVGLNYSNMHFKWVTFLILQFYVNYSNIHYKDRVIMSNLMKLWCNKRNQQWIIQKRYYFLLIKTRASFYSSFFVYNSLVLEKFIRNKTKQHNFTFYFINFIFHHIDEFIFIYKCVIPHHIIILFVTDLIHVFFKCRKPVDECKYLWIKLLRLTTIWHCSKAHGKTVTWESRNAFRNSHMTIRPWALGKYLTRWELHSPSPLRHSFLTNILVISK